jgi:Uma2 family endonuclease
MGQAAEERRFTEEEFLAFERESDIKHEFFDGEIFAMAGGTLNHSLIATNLVVSLANGLKGRCVVYNSDLRVKVQPTGLHTYPDVSVVCGKARLADEKNDILLNPTLNAEVLSSGTEAYDRGEKFTQYQAIASLTTYLLVSQDQPQIEQYVRRENSKWEYTQAAGLESVLEIPALEITLKLSEIYANITFQPRPLRKSTGIGPTAAVE